MREVSNGLTDVESRVTAKVTAVPNHTSPAEVVTDIRGYPVAATTCRMETAIL